MLNRQKIELLLTSAFLILSWMPWGLLAQDKGPKKGEGQANVIKVPAGLRARVFAQAPQIGSPVAISVADDGRVFVTSTKRRKNGNLDIRRNKKWINTELSLRSVAQKEAFYLKTLSKEKLKYIQNLRDTIHLLRDTNGDHKADFATVFDDGFAGTVTGVAAGVLAFNGDVYATVCPNLWKLRDTDGDGVVDERKAIVSGFGVHIAYGGHNMHGLTVGPDGRIYWSIGDIASNYYPNEGAVFRCEPDGSGFEVFAHGLRNPQELAFDDLGYLFTGDNDSDKGDRERWIHVVQGADYGWRIWWQFQDRGWGAPTGNYFLWNDERLWHMPFAQQAAYIMPPVSLIAAGPTGLAYYPGTGMGDRFKNHFFLAHFGGGSGEVRAYVLKRKGASFEMTKNERVFSGTAITGIDIGPDGAFYLADWIGGWDAKGQGRVIRVDDPIHADSKIVKQTSALLAQGMTKRSVDQLSTLLGHANQRVRLRAQFELVARMGIDAFAAVLTESTERLPRVHAVWGLGQILRLRDGKARGMVQAVLEKYLEDKDSEITAQVLRVLADAKVTSLKDKYVWALGHGDPMVRYFALVALGQSKHNGAFKQVVGLIAKEGAEDLYLRHGAIMALTHFGDVDAIAALKKHPSSQVRLAAVVALRKLKDAHVAEFLNDSDTLVVIEAARAINDVPITAGQAPLAALLNHPQGAGLNHPWLARRVLNANYRIGGEAQAQAIAAYAASPNAPAAMRQEAVDMLVAWQKPSPRDRVVNDWRPIATEQRSDKHVRLGLDKYLPGMLIAPSSVQTSAIKLADKLGLKLDSKMLMGWLTDPKRDALSQVAALRLLGSRKDKQLPAAIELALKSKAAPLRVEAIDQLTRRDAAAALAAMEAALSKAPGRLGSSLREKQLVFELLGRWKDKRAEALLGTWTKRLVAGKVGTALQLDIIESVKARKSKNLGKDVSTFRKQLQRVKPLGEYRLALEGGDVQAGRAVFFNKIEVQCFRCHKVGGPGGQGGGDVAPNLAGIGKKHPRTYLLESIVDPNLAFAKGYEMTTLIMRDGKRIVGKVVEETDEYLVVELLGQNSDDAAAFGLEDPKPKGQQGMKLKILKSAIKQRKSLSAMPADLVKALSLGELRDLVAFLVSQ